MATGVMIGLTAGTAALGAYSSAQQAKQANRFAGQQTAYNRQAQAKQSAYNRQVQAGQVKAAQIQSRQIEAQSALEKLKTARQGHQIRSTLRVAAGDDGSGLGGTYEALVRQADYDQALNIEVIERNALMAQESAFSRIQPLMPTSPLPPTPPQQNATLAAILGGLGGVSSGLSLGASGMSMFGAGGAARTPPPTGGTV